MPLRNKIQSKPNFASNYPPPRVTVGNPGNPLNLHLTIRKTEYALESTSKYQLLLLQKKV